MTEITKIVGLNPAQQAAVEVGDGPVLILAGPGSGKTRVLTQRIAYLIGERAVDPYNIMAVTFTNKAAKEMKERLERLIGDQVRQLTVGTFHSICVRILRREAAQLGFDNEFAIYDDDDQIGAVKSALKALNMDDKQHTPRSFLSVISKAKSELISPSAYAEAVGTYWEELAARVYKKYNETLRVNHAFDFDDLIYVTVQLFEQKPAVLERYQQRYRHLLVDEYQDTNHAQYVFAKQLADKYRNILVVGDSDQAIYSWRSADIRNILNFEQDYPEAKVVMLEQNYRSSSNIVEVAQHVIQQNSQRKEKQLWTENDAGSQISVYEAFNEEDEARYVVSEIQRLVAARKVRNRDCAVMYRTNSQSRALEEAFVRYNVAYQLVGGIRFYERREVKDVLAFLRLLGNPFDGISLARVVSNTPFGKGIGQRTWGELDRWAGEIGLPVYSALQLLAERDDLPPEHEAAAGQLPLEEGSRMRRDEIERLTGSLALPARSLRPLLDLYRILNDFIRAKDELPLQRLVSMVLDRGNFAEALRDGTEEGADRWRNVEELLTVAQGYHHLEPAEGLRTFLEDVALISDIDKLQEEKDAVTLITLHAAKGLEYKTVFLVGLEEGILPHSRSLEDNNQLEEERRLTYVGITRAMEYLYLLYTFKRTIFGNTKTSTPSRFLLDIPTHLLKGSLTFRRDQQAEDEYLDGDHPDIDIPTSGRVIGGSGRSSSAYSARPGVSRIAGAGGPNKAGGTHSRTNGNFRTETGRSTYQQSKSQPPATPASSRSSLTPGPGSQQFKTGDKVRHSIFGEGMVVSSKLVSSDEEVTVAFPGNGVKRLLQSIAKLEKV